MAENKPFRVDTTGDGVPHLAAVPERSREELEAEVCAVLLTTLALEVRDTRQDLIDGGLLDSLALVELLFELERRFELVLVAGELDIESFRSVERIARFVAEQSLGTKP